jgi:hypothetical protein
MGLSFRAGALHYAWSELLDDYIARFTKGRRRYRDIADSADGMPNAVFPFLPLLASV